MSRIAKTVRVNGRVQGVFFRAWTKQQADALGVGGWVRNCADGSVEAHVEGEDEAVRRLIERLRSGPAGADVGALSENDAKPAGVGLFEIRH